MQSDKWGSHAWEFLHTVTFDYPEEPTPIDKQHFYDLFSNLRYTLPCVHCRKSFSIFFEHINIDDYLDSRYGIVFWLYVIHNLVNIKLGKQTAVFSEVVKKYQDLRARCGKVDKEDLEVCRAGLPPIPDKEIMIFCDMCYQKYEEITLKKLISLVKSDENPIQKF